MTFNKILKKNPDMFVDQMVSEQVKGAKRDVDKLTEKLGGLLKLTPLMGGQQGAIQGARDAYNTELAKLEEMYIYRKLMMMKRCIQSEIDIVEGKTPINKIKIKKDGHRKTE